MNLLPLLVVLTAGAGLPEARDVVPVEVLRVPQYCEGIVFDAAGNGYVSMTMAKTIVRFQPDGKSATWAQTKGPNGHRIQLDGTHLVCDLAAVLHLDASGQLLDKASEGCDGKPLCAPNDLTLDPAGGFYFTDPGMDAKFNGAIHYVDRAGKSHRLLDGMKFPNGIVLRPDGKSLLVSESGRNRVLSFAVESPGKIGPLQVFCDLPAKGPGQIDNQPDGMCLDADGNLYVAHYGMRQVQVLDPRGRLVRRYAAGNLLTSNVAFGGPNADDLYVTGGVEAQGAGGVFRLHLPGVRGLRLPLKP